MSDILESTFEKLKVQIINELKSINNDEIISKNYASKTKTFRGLEDAIKGESISGNQLPKHFDHINDLKNHFSKTEYLLFSFNEQCIPKSNIQNKTKKFIVIDDLDSCLNLSDIDDYHFILIVGLVDFKDKDGNQHFGLNYSVTDCGISQLGTVLVGSTVKNINLSPIKNYSIGKFERYIIDKIKNICNLDNLNQELIMLKAKDNMIEKSFKEDEDMSNSINAIITRFSI